VYELARSDPLPASLAIAGVHTLSHTSNRLLCGAPGLHLVASPSHAGRLAGAVVRDGTTVLKLLLTPHHVTALEGDRASAGGSPGRRADAERIKRIAHAYDATASMCCWPRSAADCPLPARPRQRCDGDPGGDYVQPEAARRAGSADAGQQTMVAECGAPRRPARTSRQLTDAIPALPRTTRGGRGARCPPSRSLSGAG
jgi:hypothetical protein